MKFASSRELKINANALLRKVQRGDDVVITQYGKPAAVLVRVSEDELEEFLVMRHPKLFRELQEAYQEYKRNGGLTHTQMKVRLAGRRRG